MAVNGSKVTHSNPSKQLSRHIKEKKSTVMNFSEWYRPSLLLKNGSWWISIISRLLSSGRTEGHLINLWISFPLKRTVKKFWAQAKNLKTMLSGKREMFLSNDTLNASSALFCLVIYNEDMLFRARLTNDNSPPLQLLKFWFVSHVYHHIATGLNTISPSSIKPQRLFLSTFLSGRVSTLCCLPFHLGPFETQH